MDTGVLRHALLMLAAAALVAPCNGLSWPLCDEGGQVWCGWFQVGCQLMAVACCSAQRGGGADQPAALVCHAPVPTTLLLFHPHPRPAATQVWVTEKPRTEPTFPGANLWCVLAPAYRLRAVHAGAAALVFADVASPVTHP